MKITREYSRKSTLTKGGEAPKMKTSTQTKPVSEETAQSTTLMKKLKSQSNKKEAMLKCTGSKKERPNDFRQLPIYPSASEILKDNLSLRPNIVKGPYNNIDHYLDIQFRLLREDFLKPIRKSIKNISYSDTNVYKKVQFLRPEPVNEHNCFRILLYSDKNRKFPDFQHSNRLRNGSLLCFTNDNFKTVVFGKVCTRSLKNGELIVEFEEKFSVELNTFYTMIDCKIHFDSYFQVLRALKDMSEGNFPLEKYIIHLEMDVQPPKYLTESDCMYQIQNKKFCPLRPWPRGTFYNLNESQVAAFKAALTQEIAIVQGPPATGKTHLGLLVTRTLLENHKYWHKRSPILLLCRTNHALDRFLGELMSFTDDIIRIAGQTTNEKLNTLNLNSLSRIKNRSVWEKVEHLDGIKSKIKKVAVLLRAADSYQNIINFKNFDEVTRRTWFYQAHKDTILEWLMAGSENMALEDHILEQPKHQPFNNVDKSCLVTLKSLFHEIDSLQKSISKSGNVETEVTNKLLLLKRKYYYLSMRLEEGQKYKKGVKKPPKNLIANPKVMDPDDRWKLYFHWLNCYRNKLIHTIDVLNSDFQKTYKEYVELRNLEITKILKEALVVGITTNMAALYLSSLQSLKIPIVIVEEAAEILEVHLVTSLTVHCQHLIMFGDHHQLTPTCADLNVDTDFLLGISLFERFILNGARPCILDTQHRMREEIASLIAPIYPLLKDHCAVNQRPTINGVDKCLFFINHDHPGEGYTKMNQHEIKFFVHFTKYLLLNGYSWNNITILTLYSGQKYEFQKELSKHDDDVRNVRVSVLDGYQGEENDIILLSLVRNNAKNIVGFLGTENRICVALSRAKNGFYIMGNISQLCRDNKLWYKVKKILLIQDAIGSSLALRCKVHDVLTYVKCDADFVDIPGGGCKGVCGETLMCGHECNLACHVTGRDHEDYKCYEECSRLLCENENHKCKKKCCDPCGPCTYLVKKNLLCGHEAEIKCRINPETYDKCRELVTVHLPCGHLAQKPCSDGLVTFKCSQPCNKTLQCGHLCGLNCHINTDPEHLHYKCRKPCTKYLKGCTTEDEQHKCQKMCYQQCNPCTILVKKQKRSCGHLLEVPCNVKVGGLSCKEPCKILLKCGHQCSKLCYEKCGDCDLKVTKTYPVCGHSLKVKCMIQPDRIHCNKKCPLTLPCGHPCNAKCNEPCPTNCSKLVNCSIMAECGHIVTNVKCNLLQSPIYKEENSKLPSKFCNKPCEVKLKCGHLCSGSCSECFQGRYHKKCEEQVVVTLICNHRHELPCKQTKDPCSFKCFYKCQHNSCSRKCSDICSPCKKKCPRSCVHRRCTLTCGDICNVDPCQEACDKVLKCGHNCVGFCGEPCPPKCLICNEEFFADSAKNGSSKYVFLSDCKHVIEESQMKNILESCKGQLGFIKCPKCETPIVTTERYSTYTKKTMTDVASIKILMNGTLKENEEKHKEVCCRFLNLKRTSESLISSFPKVKSTLEALESPLKNWTKKKPVSKYQLQTLISKLDVIEFISNNCSSIEDAHRDLTPNVNFILNMIKNEEIYLSDQQIDDISMEISRFLRICQFYQIENSKNTALNNNNKGEIQHVKAEIRERTMHTKKFTKIHDEDVKELLKRLSWLISSSLIDLEPNTVRLRTVPGFQREDWINFCNNDAVDNES